MRAISATTQLVEQHINELRNQLNVARAYYRAGHPSIGAIESKIKDFELERSLIQVSVNSFFAESTRTAA